MVGTKKDIIERQDMHAEFKDYWGHFNGGNWQREIDVRDFILQNHRSYDGDESFLADATERTKTLNKKLRALMKIEADAEHNHVLDMDTNIVATINSHKPGYLDKDNELIVGLQTDAPLKQAFNPFGGIKMANKALMEAGYEPNKELNYVFNEWHETHNDYVFDIYNPEIRLARKYHVLSGLPDTYGRGRLIPDFPRIAIYGMDKLIEVKQHDLSLIGMGEMTDDVMHLRHDVALQIKALNKIKKMAESYGFDISKPAKTAQEAIQWMYFGYLATIKSENGAAMSVGRLDNVMDIYLNRDIDAGILDETGAQELVDAFVNKLRMVRFARPDAYNQLFSGQPIWATLSIAGVSQDGDSLVNKTSFRLLHTLTTQGNSPEPNLTVMWSDREPEAFRKYVSKVAVETSAIQVENDDLLRNQWGTDYYGIACCVSAQPIADGMQYFGARANLAKMVDYAITGGVDEKARVQVTPKAFPITSDVIDYDEFMAKFDHMLDWLADIYINTLNITHYSHDLNYYESASMAFKDTHLNRSFATGASGVSHVIDSISAIKYGKVHIIRDEDGFPIGYEAEQDFPKYGNNDDRADEIGVWLIKTFWEKMNRHHLYRNAKLTTSILTITSNVVVRTEI